MRLPIDILTLSPLQFQWDGCNGETLVHMSGALSHSAERPLVELINYTKKLEKENAELRGKLMTLNEKRDVNTAAPKPPAPPGLVPLKKK